MKLYELYDKTDELTDIPQLRDNKVMIRNCVDGKLYDIEEINFGLYGNNSIVIVDIKPEEE